MVTPFTRLLVAVASLATVYSVVAGCGNAWANDVTAVAHARPEMAELVQWHSGLTVISDSCVNPEWKSSKTRRQVLFFASYLHSTLVRTETILFQSTYVD